MRKAKSAKKLDFVFLSAIFSTLPLLSAHANQCSNTSDSNSTVTVDSTCTDFSNSANITHRVIQGDDNNASATGVLVEEANYPLNTFINTNTGTIKAEGQIGNVTQGYKESRGFGVEIRRDINLFENHGTLEGIASGGNAEGGATIRAEGRAFYTYNVVNKIENTATIKSEAYVGDAIGSSNPWYFSSAYATATAGPYIWGNVSEFKNSGSITNYAKGGSAKGERNALVDTWSGLVLSNVDSFTNSGRISSKAEAGNAEADDSYIYASADGVVIYSNGYFNNKDTGTIEAKAQIGNVNGTNSYAGVYVGGFRLGSIMEFKNSGTIKQEVQAGKVGGENSQIVVSAKGEIYPGDMELFENTGTISTKVTIGDVEGKNSSIYSWDAVSAVTIYGGFRSTAGILKEFNNSGNFEIRLNVGNATGEDSKIELNARGVLIDAEVETFVNQGNVTVDLRSGDASGKNSKVYVYDKVYMHFIECGRITCDSAIVGIDLNNKVNNFFNTGNIRVNVELGSATGSGSEVKLNETWGVRLNNGFESAINNGNVNVSLKVGSNGQIIDSGGYYIANANGRFENGQNGRIIVNIDAPNTSSVDGVAGIFITSSNLTSLSNSGEIRIVNNHPNARIAGIWIENSTVNNLTNNAYIYFDNSAPETNVDIRTLRIEGNSNVTLGDKFSILFMQDNVYTFNRKLEPIYVGQGSTLNLNNSTLRVGIRNFSLVEFNKCYPIAKNDGGTINGEWNLNIEKGYSNPTINVEWCDSNQRNGNAQIVFRYYQQPEPQPPQQPPTIKNPPPELASPHMTFKMHPVRLSSLLIEYVYLERQIPDVLTETLPVLRFSKKTYLASLSPVKSYEADRFLFTIPFHTYTNAHSLGYRAYANGLILGFSPKPEGKLRYGIYGAYVDGYVKAKNFPASEDLNTYAIGFYSSYLNKPYFLAFDLLGETTKHKYKGRTGFNFEIPETAKYWSRKYESKLVGGYLFSDSTWSIMPTIGVL